MVIYGNGDVLPVQNGVCANHNWCPHHHHHHLATPGLGDNDPPLVLVGSQKLDHADSGISSNEVSNRSWIL